MSGRHDRLVRVRRIQARQALAALGQAQAALNSEAALIARVTGLILSAAPEPGDAGAGALKARGQTTAMLGDLAEQLGRRLARRRDDREALAAALARAQAAVDAALARRAGR